MGLIHPTFKLEMSCFKKIQINNHMVRYQIMTTEYKVIYSFDKETGQVCAEVPALNYLSDYGNDFKEAEKNIAKAVELYLIHILKENRDIPRPTLCNIVVKQAGLTEDEFLKL